MSLVAVTRSRLHYIRGCCLSHMTTLAVAPARGWIVFVSSFMLTQETRNQKSNSKEDRKLNCDKLCEQLPETCLLVNLESRQSIKNIFI